MIQFMLSLKEGVGLIQQFFRFHLHPVWPIQHNDGLPRQVIPQGCQMGIQKRQAGLDSIEPAVFFQSAGEVFDLIGQFWRFVLV